MSSYLSIYVKPKGVDKKVLVTSFTRNDEMYDFLWENNLSGYAFDEKAKEEKFYEMDSRELWHHVQEYREEVSRNKERLMMMKSLGDRYDVEEIITWQTYVDEKTRTLHRMECLQDLFSDCNDIEKVYTNYD